MRARHRVIEVTAYAVVNLIATGVSVGLFNLLVHGPGEVLHNWPLTSYLLANAVGMVVSYLGTVHGAFRGRDTRGPAGGALRYVALNVFSFAIPMSCLWVSRELLGLSTPLADNLAANVIGAFLGFCFRYLALKRYVFTGRNEGRRVVVHARTVAEGPDRSVEVR